MGTLSYIWGKVVQESIQDNIAMMFGVTLVVLSLGVSFSEANSGYGGSGLAYIIPGTEQRAMPGIYKQDYMQPVYTTSYPVHHEQHAAPVQYVTVAPTSGYGYAPASSSHEVTVVTPVSHGHSVAPVVGHEITAAHSVNYGHAATPAVGYVTSPVSHNHGYSAQQYRGSGGHSYSPVYQPVTSVPIKLNPSYGHESNPSYGHY